MLGNSISKYFTYAKLNEITKFSDLNNICSTSGLNSLSIWIDLDRSVEKTKTDFYSKSLLGFFLLYLLTGKRPSLIKSSTNKDIILLKVTLYSKDLSLFLEKFLLVYDNKLRQKMFSSFKVSNNLFRTTIWDLGLFTELESVLEIFQSIKSVNFDFIFAHKNELKNINFIKGLWSSSFTN